MFGQAPGIVEGVQRRPWRGRAGQTLRRWLELDEERFYATFYCASVTRCYPGRPVSGRGDRSPTSREQQLCERWRDQELALLQPQLIVTVGALAARRLLGAPTLAGIGHRFELGGVVAIPLPTRAAQAHGSTRQRTANGWPPRSSSCAQSCGVSRLAE